MTITATSREAYEKIRPTIGVDQAAILAVIDEIGPCHDRRILEAINQEQKTIKPGRQKRFWEINEVSGRRNELMGKGLIWCLGRYEGIWNGLHKSYQFYAARGDNRTPQQIGWVPWTPKKAVKSENEKGKTMMAAGPVIVSVKKQGYLW